MGSPPKEASLECTTGSASIGGTSVGVVVTMKGLSGSGCGAEGGVVGAALLFATEDEAATVVAAGGDAALGAAALATGALVAVLAVDAETAANRASPDWPAVAGVKYVAPTPSALDGLAVAAAELSALPDAPARLTALNVGPPVPDWLPALGEKRSS